MATKRLAQAPAPTQPPGGADFAVLVKKVNDLSAKVGLTPLSASVTAAIPKWKRWVGGEGEYDVSGLRDRLATLVSFVNQIKDMDVDPMKQQIIDLQAEVQALKEAPAAHPFP